VRGSLPARSRKLQAELPRKKEGHPVTFAPIKVGAERPGAGLLLHERALADMRPTGRIEAGGVGV